MDTQLTDAETPLPIPHSAPLLPPETPTRPSGRTRLAILVVVISGLLGGLVIQTVGASSAHRDAAEAHRVASQATQRATQAETLYAAQLSHINDLNQNSAILARRLQACRQALNLTGHLSSSDDLITRDQAIEECDRP